MQFQKIPPPDYLRDYVGYFWTLQSSDYYSVPQALGPLADGYPGLFFQRKEDGIYRDEWNKQLPQVFLYGQTVRRTAIYFQGRFNTVGVCFKPYALKAIFGFNATELTDGCLDVNIISAPLIEQLLNSKTITAHIDILSGFISSEIKKRNSKPDLISRFASEKMISSGGSVSLTELYEASNISERSFERKFNQHVGVSPKLFSKICRFQAALIQLKKKDYLKLSDIAYDNGFADQSHFIRIFKEFSGYPPFQFQKQSYHIVDNFPVVIK